MADDRHLLICSCDKTMRFDAEKIGNAAGLAGVSSHTQLCRREVADFESALAAGKQLCVACTQESPLFAEIADEAGYAQPAFANIRELAGWTADKAPVEPKIAALLAAGQIEAAGRLRSVESDGLCLVVGAGQAALDAALLLNRSLSVTLILTGGHDEIILPQVLDLPIFTGRLVQATGSFGAFDVVVDGYAGMLPSSRGELQFAMPRDGAKSTCSVIFDMTGNPPLFSRAELRDGYFRADPGDPAAVMRAIFDASDSVGTFEKPIYVTYDAAICAHERSKKTGCAKCLDHCPAGAIEPDGDHVLIDAAICGGCGNCAAHCPTGAVAYDMPKLAVTMERLQALAKTYLDAGGKNPVLLIHDASHGMPLISAMARFGRGLPAHVLPYEMHSTSGIGHDLMVTALVAGFRDIVIMADPKKSDEYDALAAEIELTIALVEGLGHGGSRIHTTDDVDPDTVESLLWSLKPAREIAHSVFTPLGGKREKARTAIGLMVNAAKKAPDLIALPQSAPYGNVNVDKEACTLCMACVSACPADALRDNQEKPELRFVESACVQCGICQATCPEQAITIEARYNTTPSAMQPVTLNEDVAAECISCGKEFVSQKMIDRVAETLGGKHWMYADDERIRLLRMCESCRLETLAEGGKDPFAIANRPRTRTTEDYLEDRKAKLTSEDFLN